jgi:hypothetical protein
MNMETGCAACYDNSLTIAQQPNRSVYGHLVLKRTRPQQIKKEKFQLKPAKVGGKCDRVEILLSQRNNEEWKCLM